MKTKSYNLVNNVEQEEMDAGLLAEMYEVEVKDGKSVTLPSVFSSEIREDLIRRAVLASRANRRQAYGHREHDGKRAPQPGMKHSVEWWGKGRGVSRIMRKAGQRTAAQNLTHEAVEELMAQWLQRTGLRRLTAKKTQMLATQQLRPQPIQKWSQHEVTNLTANYASQS